MISQISASRHFGAISEKMFEVMCDYLSNNPTHQISSIADHQRGIVTTAEFKELLYYENMKALAEPGEAVGLLAAQVWSINYL